MRLVRIIVVKENLLLDIVVRKEEGQIKIAVTQRTS